MVVILEGGLDSDRLLCLLDLIGGQDGGEGDVEGVQLLQQREEEEEEGEGEMCA